MEGTSQIVNDLILNFESKTASHVRDKKRIDILNFYFDKPPCRIGNRFWIKCYYVKFLYADRQVCSTIPIDSVSNFAEG